MTNSKDLPDNWYYSAPAKLQPIDEISSEVVQHRKSKGQRTLDHHLAEYRDNLKKVIREYGNELERRVQSREPIGTRNPVAYLGADHSDPGFWDSRRCRMERKHYIYDVDGKSVGENVCWLNTRTGYVGLAVSPVQADPRTGDVIITVKHFAAPLQVLASPLPSASNQ